MQISTFSSLFILVNTKTYLAKIVKNDDTISETAEGSKEGIDYSEEDEPQLLIDLNPKGMVIIKRISRHNL